ncbi:MAG: M20/M25/M40 family metallo-hydrolase [Anaerovoracaceae bacterium]
MGINHTIDFEKIETEVKKLLYSYLEVQSLTNSENEKKVEDFFLSHFSRIKYFKEKPDSYGLYKIDGDAYDRSVCWAMVRGIGKDTVVMVHHYDVVGVEDFKALKDFAFKPDELRKQLLENMDMLQEDAKKDLMEDTFIFGRGGADMKAGGSIQYSLLEEYSELDNFIGNVIVIGVPDEENLSAGMRGAVKLLANLKEKYGLDYKMMINSEPHQRKDFSKGVFSVGSVGKLMPFVYVRGFLSHAGKVFEGFNPVNLMAEITRETELNMEFADVVGSENAPPPTWLYLKDSKVSYDVSMPLSAAGCFSVLTLKQTPEELLEKVENVITAAFDKVIKEMNVSYKRFLANTKQEQELLPWSTKVVNFKQLYEEAKGNYGIKFTEEYDKKVNSLAKLVRSGALPIIESNFKLIEFIYDFIDDISPKVVYGLIPPYYPSVSNLAYEDSDEKVRTLCDLLTMYSEESFSQSYTKEYFYTGISDLSYTYIKDANKIKESLEKSMPLFGKMYDIPLKEISDISMPCINIGPWGKDFHKLTERVNKEDVCIRTPKILDRAIKIILG